MGENNQNKTRDSQIRASNKYAKAHYKQLKVSLKPEEVDDIKETARSEGKSIAGYIIDLHKEHIAAKNNNS